MELKEYIKIMKKESKLIFVIAFIVTFSTLLFSILQPNRYETSLSLLISKDKSQQTDEFKYDGYYSLESSEKIADSIVQWVKSPELVNAVYIKAEVDGGFGNLKSYTKKFNAIKMSSQYIEVKFETNNIEEAEKISVAVISEVSNKVAKLKNDSEGDIAFLISNEKPIIIQKQKNILLNSIIGFISGMFLGMFYIFFRRYFSR
ncbi:MAG: hypothetical protein KAI67_04695 [Candidatus Pacebacteria bacterium]|nr:hypothetical protein [Candidatus Paceibacterota bacterium]